MGWSGVPHAPLASLRPCAAHRGVSVLLLLLVLVCAWVPRAAASHAWSASPTCASIVAERRPRQYVAYSTHVPPVIDGDLDDPAWVEAAWTSDFVDISTPTRPWQRTRAKMRWDARWLYVGAELEEEAIWANITHTCHCIDPSADQVIFHDNDFEVFVDADGSCAFYKEFEINAANATWDLCLNKPYENGGYENSTRVLNPGFDLVPPLRSAVRAKGCRLNVPGRCASWTVEVQLLLCCGLEVCAMCSSRYSDCIPS